MKKLRLCVCIACIIAVAFSVFSIPVSVFADNAFEAQISQFPESYKPYLRTLHSEHPSWVFFADRISMTFDAAVETEYSVPFRKVVNMNSDNISWRSMADGVYNWGSNSWNTIDNGKWTGASKEVIAYHMDPRNFLNSTDAYMFLQQSYAPSIHTADGVRKIIANTFLANDYQGGSYLNDIMEAARQSGVSPYIIASTIITEQGNSGSSDLISGGYPGYEGYYNFFNFGATGGNVVANGLSTAKTNGWNSRSAAIIGGAKRYAEKYISIGQDTYFYKDFNIRLGDFNHQYAQSVYDAKTSANVLARFYSSTGINDAMSFYIPVYSYIPDTPAQKPGKTGSKNNYYLTALSAPGISPAFSMYNSGYSLSVSGDTTVGATPLAGSSIVSQTLFNLNAGNNTVPITVRAETGYTNTYYINVNAALPVTLTISASQSSSGIKGDTNSDGNVNVVDLANIQKHIVGRIVLGGSDFSGADTNGDGIINVVDLANIQKHIVGRIVLS